MESSFIPLDEVLDIRLWLRRDLRGRELWLLRLIVIVICMVVLDVWERLLCVPTELVFGLLERPGGRFLILHEW